MKFGNVALAGMPDDVAYIPIEPEPDYAAHLVSELDVNNGCVIVVIQSRFCTAFVCHHGIAG